MFHYFIHLKTHFTSERAEKTTPSAHCLLPPKLTSLCGHFWPYCVVGNVILIAVSLLGTFAFIMLLIFRGSVNANVIVITAVFPLSLVAAAYSIYRGEQRYFVLTNK